MLQPRHKPVSGPGGGFPPFRYPDFYPVREEVEEEMLISFLINGLGAMNPVVAQAADAAQTVSGFSTTLTISDYGAVTLIVALAQFAGKLWHRDSVHKIIRTCNLKKASECAKEHEQLQKDRERDHNQWLAEQKIRELTFLRQIEQIIHDEFDKRIHVKNIGTNTQPMQKIEIQPRPEG